jgi:hypothetical protein
MVGLDPNMLPLLEKEQGVTPPHAGPIGGQQRPPLQELGLSGNGSQLQALSTRETSTHDGPIGSQQ